jgi:hypothetical protein
MEITWIKKGLKRTTCSIVSEQTVVDAIKEEKYKEQTDELRTLYNIIPLRGNVDQRNVNHADPARRVPWVCFASRSNKQTDDVSRVDINRLVLIEINNLENISVAEDIRNCAIDMPQTRITFVGADGHSVKIIVGYQFSMRNRNLEQPFTTDENIRLHTAAYRMASLAYRAQLGLPVDNIQPTFFTSCLLSSDRHIFYNSNAVPFIVGTKQLEELTTEKKPLTVSKDDDSDDLLPGKTLEQTQRYVFECCLQKVFDNCVNEPDDTFADKALHLLARYCHESGLPMEMAIKHTCFNPDIGDDEEYVRSVYRNIYRKELKSVKPLAHVNNTALLTYKTWALLTSRYELRRNAVTEQVEYRNRNGFNYSFVPLTERRRNSMTIEALKEGLNSWDKDLKRFIESDEIYVYDPIDDYMDSLPEWDGVDRIGELARRVPNDNPDWEMNFHTWMLSMVAQWRGRNSSHGNAIIPLLTGYQGSGKSTFCSSILPPELMPYYNDKLTFDNDNAVQMALSRFALINIDEFDSLKKSQQPILKYLAQKNDVKVRTLYTQKFETHRRYASFIGTTNNATPLSDETGSRRFICTRVTGTIDNVTPLNYNQIYAQALSELSSGARYWFNDAENAVIQKRNERFNSPAAVTAMMVSTFAQPTTPDDGEEFSIDDIITALKQKYHNLKVDGGLNVKVGHYLVQNDYIPVRTSSGKKYRAVRL